MNVRDQDIALPAAASAIRPRPLQIDFPVEYSSPAVVRLGKTSDLILGLWMHGYADYMGFYKHEGD
jgi:hypothetical protein